MNLAEGALVDLHVHSLHSDGTLTPQELVQLAARRNVGVLALTDHDSVRGCAAASAACAEHGIAFVAGVELTCGWLERELHVVGLGVDVAHAGLGAHLAGLIALRRERILAIGQRLKEARLLGGHDIAADVLGTAEVPTRTHLARRIVELGHAQGLQEAFDRFLGRGRTGYVKAAWPTMAETVGVVRAAGGVAVLAHPHRYRLSSGQLDALCAAFAEAGGEGMEVSLAGLSPNDYDRLCRLARRHGLAGSVASDFHEPGLPWRPLGRFAKLPDQIVPLLERLQPTPRLP